MSLKKNQKTAIALIGLAVGLTLMLISNLSPPTDSTDDPTSLSAETYRAQVEERVKTLCSAVKGTGEVSVFVTVSGGYENIYSVDNKGECVTVGSGSSERAVVESVRSPEIVGVGIVCTGAKDPALCQVLVELVSSALGIGTNRIVVAEGN